MTSPLTPKQPNFRPVYLVELFDQASGELIEADVTGSVSNAVHAAIDYIKRDEAIHVTGIDVQLHESKTAGIEGIAFFSGESADQMVVCVSRYELNNEESVSAELAPLDRPPTSCGDFKSLIAEALNA